MDRQPHRVFVLSDVAKSVIERVSMKALSPVADFSFDYHDLHFIPAEKASP